MVNQSKQPSEAKLSREELIELTNQQYKAFIEAKRKYVLQDFWEFCKEVICWQDLDEGIHKSLCEFLQVNRGKKRLCILPRGHLKSSIITISYSLWRIAQDPSIRILIVNATNPLAITFLDQIKDNLTKNTNFIELFGNLSEGAEKWSDEAITIARPKSFHKKEPTVTAFGIGGNLVSQHYDLILLDDLVNRDNIRTPDRMADVNTFYKDVVDLFDSQDNSELIIIGTRWHQADLYGWLLEDENPARHEFMLMQRDAVEGDYEIVMDPKESRYHIEGGTIIFPKKFTREGLNKLINDKGISEFSAQYLNNPVPSSQATFKHAFKYYEIDDLRGQDVNRFITTDLAIFDPNSKSRDLDYTVFMVVDVNADNNWFIREIVRARMQPREIIGTMFSLDELWHPKTFGVESTLFQKVFIMNVKEEFKKRNHYIPITELRHSGSTAKSKSERIQALEPRYASGSIYHNKSVRNMAILEDELTRFPRSRHDDCSDALASIIELAHPPRKRDQRDEGGNRRGFMGNYPA